MAQKLEIIFVRHGESCANILKEKYPLSPLRFSIQDPQLTERGIKRSEILTVPLQKFIQQKWGSNKNFMIGASAMMRAQMTAFYQLARELKKPIHIFPHICEKGLTVDNLPYEKTKQQELLRERNPQIVRYLNSGNDYRSEQTTATKSDILLFLEWVRNHQDLFKPTSRGSIRLVVFTHGHFIRSGFSLPDGVSLSGQPLKNETIMNNGFLYTQFYIGPTDYPHFEVFHDKTKYILPYICPDKCTRTVCKKTEGGRARKTRRQRRK